MRVRLSQEPFAPICVYNIFAPINCARQLSHLKCCFVSLDCRLNSKRKRHTRYFQFFHRHLLFGTLRSNGSAKQNSINFITDIVCLFSSSKTNKAQSCLFHHVSTHTLQKHYKNQRLLALQKCNFNIHQFFINFSPFVLTLGVIIVIYYSLQQGFHDTDPSFFTFKLLACVHLSSRGNNFPPSKAGSLFKNFTSFI